MKTEPSRNNSSKPDPVRRGTRCAAGLLTLVATPIGNLEDLSPRAVAAFQNCDLVAAEDTRLTGRMLARFGIKKPMISCFDANESPRSRQVVQECLSGKNVCLATSAGHPCVSDPGYRIVREAVLSGIEVSVIPGPCAAVSALSVSGLPTDEFTFHGFLPRQGSERAGALSRLAKGGTHILYESPRRLKETLEDLRLALRDPRASVTRELTKLHEETVRGRCSEIIAAFEGREVQGEITITLHIEEPPAASLDAETLRRLRELKRRLSLSDKDASVAAAVLLGVSRKTAYQALLQEEGAG